MNPFVHLAAQLLPTVSGTFSKKGFFPKTFLKTTMILLALAAVNLQSSFGQTTFTGSYTQDFNTLATSGTSSTLPAGWAFSESGGGTTYTASAGGSGTGDTYSFGTGTNTERALGEVTSGGNTSTFGVRFTNNTGSTITSLTISYKGEQWRSGDGNGDVLNFSYNPTNGITTVTGGTWTSVAALDFNSVNNGGSNSSLDGNLGANQATITGAVTGLSIANGATFWIRWQGSNISGNDDGMSIDDLSVTNCSSTPSPSITITETSGNTNNDGIICNSASATLDAGSYSAYLWSTGATTQTIAVSPGVTTTYTVIVTSSGCQVSASATVTVNTPPTASASASPSAFCSGQSSTLSSTATSPVNTPSFSNLTSGSIPDNSSTGVSRTITASGLPASMAGLTGISVTMNVTHGDDNHVEAYLVRPGGGISNSANGGFFNTITAGESICLVADRGGSGNNFTNTVFEDGGAALSGGSAPFTGTFQPENAFSTLTGDPNGTWTLKVVDDQGGSTGTLSNWTITFTYSNGVSYSWTSSPAGFTSSVQNPGSVSPTVTTTYNLVVTDLVTGCTASSSATVTIQNPTFTISATPPTICAGGSSLLAVTNVMPTNVAQMFPNSGGITITDDNTATPFPSSITTSGLPPSGVVVSSVSFTTLTHPEPQDLDIALVGPNGQYIWLTSDAGGSGTITNFNLTFQDGGTAISTSAFINGGTYDPGNLGGGDFTPAGTMIANLSNFSGNQNGTWSLYIDDDSSTDGNGSLASWSITFSLPAITYAWSNGPTTPSQSVSPVSTTSYTVTVTDPGYGCSATASVTVTNNTPSCSITGPDPVCANTMGHVYSAPMGMTTYAWSIAGNGTIPGSTSGQTASVNAGSAGTYTVTVVVTAANGCTSSCSKTVTVNANPTCSISGPDPVCAGTSGHVYSAPMGMTTYAWSVAGNGTIPGSTSGQTASVNAGSAGTYTVTVVVTDANGCTSSCSKTVAVNANPTCSISGPDPVCAGTSGHVYSAPMGMSAYAWSITGNGTIPGSTSGQTASVNAGSAGTYTVTVVVTDANGCTSSCSKTVTVNSLPTAAISGALSFCTGGSTTLTASGGTSYLWDDASTNPVRNITAGGTYTVQVTDGNSCTDTEMATVAESPAATADAGGPYEGCGTSPVAIEATANGSGSWSGGLGSFGSASSTTTTYTPHASEIGTMVTLTWTTDDPDGAGPCTSVSDNATLNVGTPASADAGGPYATCGATPVAVSATASGTGSWSGGLGSFANATNASTSYTAHASEFGTTVILTWTTDDPDGVGGCTAVMDNASLSVSGQEINVEGNGMSIATGDATPTTADHTDFGWTMVSSGAITKTFSIQNAGSSSLTLPGATPVTLSGAHAGDFTVTMQPGSPVANGGSTMFQIEFDPSAAGVRSATVSIANNDCDENPYTFDIIGTGTIQQAISVFGNGNPITNRANTTSVTDDTDFGSLSTGGMVSHTFTIMNVANGAPLVLTGNPVIAIADKNTSDFTVTAQATTPIAGGSSTTFTIKFQPSTTGLRTAIVMIACNDLPENPFVFTVEGIGL